MMACVCRGKSAYRRCSIVSLHAVKAAGLLTTSIPIHITGYVQSAKFADSDQLTQIHN